MSSPCDPDPTRGVKAKILLVDDSGDLREAYHAALSSMLGYQVLAVGSVDEAMEQARSWHPDLILTDISMPGRIGFDLITQVRSDLPAPVPKIGVISGFPDFESEALQRGATAFELKPVGAEALRSFVEGLLQSAPPSRERRERVLRERSAVSLAAKDAVEATLLRHPEFLDRVRLATRVLSRYFDGAVVLVLLIRGGELRVVGSSDPEAYAVDSVVDGLLGYAAEVIESGASLVVSDAGTRAALRRETGLGCSLLVSTPFHAPNGRPIGSLTIVGDRARVVDAVDLAICEHMAHRGSDILAGGAPRGLLAGYHLFERDTWRLLLRLEQSRVRMGCAIGVTLIEPEAADDGSPSECLLESLSSRMALGELDRTTWGIFKLAQNAEQVREAMRATTDAIGRCVGIRRAAAVTFSGFDPPERIEALLDIAHAALSTARRRPVGTVLRASVGLDAQPPEASAPKRDGALAQDRSVSPS